jgi:hypothetical protein
MAVAAAGKGRFFVVVVVTHTLLDSVVTSVCDSGSGNQDFSMAVAQIPCNPYELLSPKAIEI